MKKLALLTLSVFTLCFSSLCGCGNNKSVSFRPFNKLTEETQITEIDENTDAEKQNQDCPDCGDDRPTPRKSCKRNRKRPPRRKVTPDNANKKSPD